MSSIVFPSPVFWVRGTFRIDLPLRVAFALGLGALYASAESTFMLDIPLRCVRTGMATALLPVVAMTATAGCISCFHFCNSSFHSTRSDLDPIACRKKVRVDFRQKRPR